jgi:hypothetical protein
MDIINALLAELRDAREALEQSLLVLEKFSDDSDGRQDEEPTNFKDSPRSLL